MANAGVKGTIACTSLKNTFKGLVKGATLTSDAFGEVEITAVKADGTMKSFGETVDELRGYFSQMTDAEKMMNTAMTNNDQPIRHPLDSKNLCVLFQKPSMIDR